MLVSPLCRIFYFFLPMTLKWFNGQVAIRTKQANSLGRQTYDTINCVFSAKGASFTLLPSFLSLSLLLPGPSAHYFPHCFLCRPPRTTLPLLAPPVLPLLGVQVFGAAHSDTAGAAPSQTNTNTHTHLYTQYTVHMWSLM